MDKERFSDGTRKHKICTLEAVKRLAKIRTFADPLKNILESDEWLHDGSRTDVSVHTYHKHLRKVTRYLDGRYDSCWSIRTCQIGAEVKQRTSTPRRMNWTNWEQLSWLNLWTMCETFSSLLAYTGLAYCDVQVFNFDQMTEKIGNIYYIDERLKTGTSSLPYLNPGNGSIEEVRLQLTQITNQVYGNEYLHLTNMPWDCKSLTFFM